MRSAIHDINSLKHKPRNKTTASRDLPVEVRTQITGAPLPTPRRLRADVWSLLQLLLGPELVRVTTLFLAAVLCARRQPRVAPGKGSSGQAAKAKKRKGKPVQNSQQPRSMHPRASTSPGHRTHGKDTSSSNCSWDFASM